MLLQDYYASRTDGHSEIRKRRDPVVYGTAGNSTRLDKQQLEQYRGDGYLFLENLFSPEEVNAILSEVERLKKMPGKSDDETYITEPGSGEVRSIFQVHRKSSIFAALACEPRVLETARQILADDVYIHQSRVNLKPGFHGREFYWHSDFETWHTEDGMPRMRALSCSITLTDNHSFNGPLMVIPGSHDSYVVCAGETPENHYKQSLKKQEYGVPGRDQLRALVDQGGIQVPTGPAGSVLFFDCNLMHGSNGNITPFPRTNVFIVYNSCENKLEDPFCGLPPRPEHIAARRHTEILKPSGIELPAGK